MKIKRSDCVDSQMVVLRVNRGYSHFLADESTGWEKQY